VNIGYENGKAILKIYRREGRVTNNKIKEQPRVTKTISKLSKASQKVKIPVLKAKI
tara:strand:+ start:481 stop:648 length:168 start_codon:yes stop_codon:yes gene_type:complete